MQEKAMRVLRISSLCVFALVASVEAHADPYTILANGDVLFNTSLTTQGTFVCGFVLTCTGAGTDSITLHSGTGAATLTFTGVSTTVQLGNTAIPVTLGTFEGVSTADFSVPSNANPNVPVVGFNFLISQSSPVPGTDRLAWEFGPTFTRIGEGGRTYLQLPIGENPPGYHYSYAIYTLRVFPLTLPLNGSKDLIADAGVVPEPASAVFLATGLVGAFWTRRRARSRVPAVPN
jgi:hypothetical protein